MEARLEQDEEDLLEDELGLFDSENDALFPDEFYADGTLARSHDGSTGFGDPGASENIELALQETALFR